MKGRPETNTENPNYTAEMVECLAYLTDSELAALTEPRSGLHTVCRYLPTPADVHGFLRDAKARQEASRPAPTTWRKLEGESGPWDLETDYERKKRVVRELLGYDPDQCSLAPRTLTPPTADDLSKLDLKTPAAEPSAYLLKTLQQQGYRFPKRTPEAE